MRLRVMTYNILDGAKGREQLVLDILKATEPDVVVLQEVVSRKLVEHFAQILDMHPIFSRGNSRRHIGLLSKLPVTSHGTYAPFPLRTGLLEATVEYASGKEINIYGVHLQAHYWIGFELWRLREINTILRRIKEMKQDQTPALVAGDFNAVAPGDTVHVAALPLRFRAILLLQGNRIYRIAIKKLLKTDYVDCYRLTHPAENGFTLPTHNPHVRLDYIFANGRLKDHLVDCAVVTNMHGGHQASDHYPLIAEFQF
jgi:exodeoxyribonuclease-3